MTTPEKIKFYRNKKGLTQQQLAEKLGITPQAVGLYEKSRNKPKLETLERFADALGIHVSELLPESVSIQAPLPNTLSNFFKNLTHRKDTPEMESLLKSHDVNGHFIRQLEALYNYGDKRYILTNFIDCILSKKFTGDELQTLELLIHDFSALDSNGKDEMLRYASWIMARDRPLK